MNRSGKFKYGAMLLFGTGIAFLLFPFVVRNLPRETRNEQEIGKLYIPSIEVELPIYEGVETEALEQGVGHIKNSSLPGNGKNTHCLLAGHRGLPRASLLERLGELEDGEIFLISLGGKQYAYRVCDIYVIRPDETEVLEVKEGRELVSVITCTPYGIYTHRLVVTGERVKK